MTSDDERYIERLLAMGRLRSPCLELGVGYSGMNNKARIQAARIEYYGTDRVPGPDVDFVVNFEDTGAVRALQGPAPRFGSALVLNVLEHTFDPIRVLDNVVSLIAPGGTCAVVTPTVWPLHNFPSDCWRINPDFYEQYASRRGLQLDESTFEYVAQGRVRSICNADGSYALPKPWNGGSGLWSRVVHKVFHTHGRRMFFPSHVAVGAVLIKPAGNDDANSRAPGNDKSVEGSGQKI